MFVGETVQLNSGGPVMTVETVKENEVTCVWFDNFEVVRDTFKEVLLIKV